MNFFVITLPLISLKSLITVFKSYAESLIIMDHKIFPIRLFRSRGGCHAPTGNIGSISS